MSVLSKISTFVKYTLLYIRAFMLRPFHREESPTLPSIALAPDLENCIVDIRHDSSDPDNKGIDLENDVFNLASPVVGQNIFSEIASTKTVIGRPCTIDCPPILDHIGKYSASKGRNPLLSNVTNVASTPPHKHVRQMSHGENIAPAPSQKPRKPTPLRRMPRYLNLTGASPTKSAVSAKKSSSKSRHSSLVHFRNESVVSSFPFKSTSSFCVHSTPVTTPSRLESGLPGESVDLAARIRSVFYKPREMGDERENVRDFFDRESTCSGFALDHAKFIKDLDAGLDDEEDDYGKPLSVRSMCYSPSAGRKSLGDPFCSNLSPASSIPGMPPSESSELAYLRDHSTSFVSRRTGSSSRSSASFKDLISSVKHKYPGSNWEDIVQFADQDGGVAAADEAETEGQWSEVFSLDDYAA